MKTGSLVQKPPGSFEPGGLFCASKEGIEVPTAVQEGQRKGQNQKKRCTDHTKNIRFGEGAAGIPSTLGFLSKAPKLHGVGDGFNPLHGGQNQGDKNGAGSLQPVNEAGFPAHLRASSLLSLGNIPILPLDIRNIAQSQSHRIADSVADTNPVQRGRKFRGVGGAHEQQHNGNGAGIFQNHIEVIEQLLGGQTVGPGDGKEHRFAPV